MRVILRLSGDGDLIPIPQEYNHLVQAAIYNNISPSLSRFLHEKGFAYGKRMFKMFTFSRLLGKCRKEGDYLLFEKDVALCLSSPIERFIEDIANTIIRSGAFRIGPSKLSVVKLEFPDEPKFRNNMKIRTLSPITVYSTVFMQNGRKRTYYYSPYEDEFSILATENLRKKAYVLNKKKIKSDVDVIPLKVMERVVMYKDTIVRGWSGIFSIKGPISLMRIAYETGLGAKNPEGFGMFEVI
jgi:CRISPR-associated endoribonuclease Cas6